MKWYTYHTYCLLYSTSLRLIKVIEFNPFVFFVVRYCTLQQSKINFFLHLNLFVSWGQSMGSDMTQCPGGDAVDWTLHLINVKGSSTELHSILNDRGTRLQRLTFISFYITEQVIVEGSSQGSISDSLVVQG